MEKNVFAVGESFNLQQTNVVMKLALNAMSIQL